MLDLPANDPGFFRGDEPQGVCDFMLPSGDCCDATARYVIWWHPVPALDLDSRPVSGACLDHALPVDRALVERMTSLREVAHA